MDKYFTALSSLYLNKNVSSRSCLEFSALSFDDLDLHLSNFCKDTNKLSQNQQHNQGKPAA